MIKIFLTVLFLIAILTFPQVSLANENQSTATTSAKLEGIVLTPEQINPKDHFSYGVKRLKEKLMLLVFSYSKDKQAEYLEDLTMTRLAELKYVVEDSDMGNFENTTQRYFTAAGTATDFLLTNNLESRKSAFSAELNSYLPVLENLRDTFDPDSSQWRFMHDTINYSKIYIDKLK